MGISMKSLVTWHRQRKLASYEARLAEVEAKIKFLNGLTPTRDDEGLPWSFIIKLEDYTGDIASLKYKIAYLKLKLGIKD